MSYWLDYTDGEPRSRRRVILLSHVSWSWLFLKCLTVRFMLKICLGGCCFLDIDVAAHCISKCLKVEWSVAATGRMTGVENVGQEKQLSFPVYHDWFRSDPVWLLGLLFSFFPFDKFCLSKPPNCCSPGNLAEKKRTKTNRSFLFSHASKQAFNAW